MTTPSLILSSASLPQVLGFGDFYYELGVQIVEACLATRPLNGGLMEMKPLMRFVNVSPCCTLSAFLQPYFPLQSSHAHIFMWWDMVKSCVLVFKLSFAGVHGHP